jgi:hypothetical protein
VPYVSTEIETKEEIMDCLFESKGSAMMEFYGKINVR